MRIAIYDGLFHHLFLAGPMAEALRDLGHDVIVIGPRGSLGEVDVEVPRARSATRRLPFVAELIPAARSVRAARAVAHRFGADVFVDTELDQRVFLIGLWPDETMRAVNILHGSGQFADEFGRRHPLRPVMRRLRARAFRRALTGGITICCRPELAARAAEAVPGARPVVIPYPIVHRRAIDTGPGPGSSHRDGFDDGRPLVLVAGQIRPDKRVDVLSDALGGIGDPVELAIVGRGASSAGGSAALGAHQLRVVDRPLSDAEMGDWHRRASVVWAPVPDELARCHRVRGALPKAAAYGAPVLTTPDGAAQLPDGYGVVVVESLDVHVVRRGLEEALARRAELLVAARGTGPAYVRDNHTFEAFAERLDGVLAGRPLQPGVPDGPIAARRGSSRPREA